MFAPSGHAAARQGRAVLHRQCRCPVAASADGGTVGGRLLAVASPATDRYDATTLFDAGAAYAGAAPRGLPFTPLASLRGLMIGQRTKWLRRLPLRCLRSALQRHTVEARAERPNDRLSGVWRFLLAIGRSRLRTAWQTPLPQRMTTASSRSAAWSARINRSARTRSSIELTIFMAHA